MKSFRTTLIFAVLVLAIGGYSFWEYQKGEKEKSAEEHKGLVVDLPQGKLTSVFLKNAKGTLKLEKIDGVWKQIEPLQDYADEEEVQAWFSQIFAEKAQSLKDQVEGVPDWGKFHIESDSPHMEFVAEDQKVSLDFSTYNAFDGSFFIRRDEELLVGGANWAGLIEKDPGTFRSKNVFEGLGNLRKIELKDEKARSFLLEKTDQGWKLAQPSVEDVDAEYVHSYLAQIESLKASEVLKELPDKAQLKSWGLDKSPVLKLTPDVGDALEFVLSNKKSKKQIDAKSYIYSPLRSAVFRVSEEDLSKLLVDPSYFRNRKKMFDMAWDKVSAIEVTEKGKTLHYLKEGKEWKSPDMKAEESWDRAKMVSLIEELKSLEASAILKKDTTLGSPRGEIVVHAGKDQLLKLEVGHQEELSKVLPSENPVHPIRVSGYPEVVALRKVIVDRLFSIHPIQPKAMAPKESSAPHPSGVHSK
ncbi:MAG: DUF4340 domain-containing protein [Bdellovibrionales bacterium]|nr:DUF4340 domain-containing protein [Bdellovibrionales bacterium]